MLIDFDKIKTLLQQHKITIRGALHIGAHNCEEIHFYTNTLGLDKSNIIWVDGNHKKVEEMKDFGVYHAVIDETERETEFNITDNTQASSLLKLNHEEGFYNDITITEVQNCKTERLTTFLDRIGKTVTDHNFWNLDIQGSELAVLRGSKELLKDCDAVYSEVNSACVYKNCGLVDEIDALLGSYGFQRIETEWTSAKWGDALYLKTK